MTVASAVPAPPSFRDRVACSLARWADPTLVTWAVAAADVVEAQIADVGGSPHRELAAPIGRWLRMPAAEQEAIGDALDLLQVAFDLSDNLADVAEDAARGLTERRSYGDIPTAVRTCLPAYLVATSRERLEIAFASRPGPLRETGRLVHGVLGAMVLGQGCDDPIEKARLVSGEQAKLLCLPAWLCAPHTELTDAVRADLLAWAEAWGTSWQLGFDCQEHPSPAAQERWMHSVLNARARWPQVGPFLPDGPLAANSLLSGLC